jgi:hypothetical protein
VTGIVKPRNPASPNLEFEVNLPLNWNGRALQMGGGGYDGSLVTGLGAFTLQPADADAPLKQGFVTLGSDGGHKSTGFGELRSRFYVRGKVGTRQGANGGTDRTLSLPESSRAVTA